MAQFLESIEEMVSPHGPDRKRRGLNVLHYSQITPVTGLIRDGQRITGTVERPLFRLTVRDREELAKWHGAVFGVVTGRMRRVMAREWHVTCDRKNEDRIAEDLKDLRSQFREHEDNPFRRAQLFQEIQQTLPDVRPDLANFDTALLRWRRRIKVRNEDRSTEIEEWLQHPNNRDNFDAYRQIWTWDMHVHGGAATYKEPLNGRLENFYVLPGGSVLPFRSRFVGGPDAYVQLALGEDPRIYFGDEISFHRFVPTSSQAYPLVPLEALVNKLVEGLLFDALAATRADGTRPPDKAIIFGTPNPFDPDSPDDKTIPMSRPKMERLETSLNELKKHAIKVLSGVGQPIEVDLSRTDLFQHQAQRQRQQREDIALVFNMSNMEVNLAGSDETAGRATSESQERIEEGKGTLPLLKQLESHINQDIIPFRFGTGYLFEHKPGRSEIEELRLLQQRVNTGQWTRNELRTEEQGLEPIEGPDSDAPTSNQRERPVGDELDPVATRTVA